MKNQSIIMQPRPPAVVRGLSIVTKAAALLGLVSLAFEYGFYTAPLAVHWLIGVQVAAVGLFVLTLLVELITGGFWNVLRRRAIDVGLVALGVVVLAVEFELRRHHVLKAATVYVGTLQVMLIGRFLLGTARGRLFETQQRIHPARMMAVSFLVVIVLGGLLLSLPRATAPELGDVSGHYLTQKILNCFFTSVSATCVTGLVIYDTGRDFTLFGQTVILVLIQMGGLGIMIFGSVFGVIGGRQFSLRQSLVLQDALSHKTIGQLQLVVRFILISTFLFEFLGAVQLYSMWPDSMTGGSRCFYSIFHAVSAFCNAGFALPGDNILPYRGSWQIYTSIMPLIVLGGLGFPVLHDLFTYGQARLSQWRSGVGGGRNLLPSLEVRRLGLHSKIVLTSTAILIVLPAVLLFWFETPSALQSRSRVLPTGEVEVNAGEDAAISLPVSQRMAAALFQSITTRTAGFNTVAMDCESMSTASHFLMAVLMFIGGSPASTAGGIKTVSLAVMLIAVVSTLRRRQNAEAFHRTIPQAMVRQAATVTIVMFMLVALVTLSLCVTEAATLRETLFEATSACGTVGLTTGLTPRLTTPGRVVIMLAMFAGRLGPLTMLVAMAGRQRPARYDYPTGNVIIS